MMVIAVTMEGLPGEEHRLLLPPSPVRFRPHGSDWLPSTWDKLSQEAGAGEQLPGAKGSEQSLVFPEPTRLSMVLKACCGLNAGSNWENQDFLGFTISSLFLCLSLAAASAPSVSYTDQPWRNQRRASARRERLRLSVWDSPLLASPSHLRSTGSPVLSIPKHCSQCGREGARCEGSRGWRGGRREKGWILRKATLRVSLPVFMRFRAKPV